MTAKTYQAIADVARVLESRTAKRRMYYGDRTWLDDEDERMAAALNRVLRDEQGKE